MAKKIEESTIKEMLDYYINNSVSMLETASKFKVSVGTIWKYAQQNGVKIDAQRGKRGRTPWNLGLSKTNDPRVAKFAKTNSINTYRGRRRDGYATVWCDELNKRMLEHHYAIYKATNRVVDTKNGEQVHHIDGDKNNNDIDNLLLTNVSEHSSIHKKMENIVFELIRDNYIYFDKATLEFNCEKLWKRLKQ